MRVVVIGAGLAGLTAAERLTAAGADVVVLEGGARVGGRARTVEGVFAGRQIAESGAEWIDTDHSRMLALVERFGLQLEGAGQVWTFLRRFLYRNGRLYTAEQLDELSPRLRAQLDAYADVFDGYAAGIADPSSPHRHPDATQVDALSMADVADRLELDEVARLFAARNAQGEFAEEPARVSALFVAQQRAQQAIAAHEVRSHRVVGGISQIARGLAGVLPPGAVRLGHRVHRIVWSMNGAAVVTDRDEFACDRVVVACALPAVRAIDFEPHLPDDLARAVVDLGYGTVTKTAIQYPERSWPAGYANNDLASQRIYEPTVDQPGRPGILMAYTGGDGGRRLATHDEADRVAIVAADIAAMYAPAAPEAAFSRAWSAEPRFGGSYAVYQPGQVTAFWEVLRRPVGPLALAGEHVATWTGYLEGAVESGETVAEWALTSN